MIQSRWVCRQNWRKLWSRGGCIYKIEIPIYRFSVFFLRYSVFFGICNTDFGIGIGILKYLGIRYRYRLPTQDRLDYNCHNTAAMEVTSYKKCSKTSLCADTTAESVMPLFDRFAHDVPRCSAEFSPCLNQPLSQLDHNPHSGVHAYASCTRCDNP